MSEIQFIHRRQTEPFEWYQNYSAIRHFFTNTYLSHTPELLPPQREQKVLIIGCGNSQLSEEMKKDGFGCVTSIDFSRVVIQQMQNKYGPNSNYDVADVKKLPYPDNSFGVIVCKGTMDSILCGSGSLNDIRSTMLECSRVLNNYGALVIITYGPPVDRMVYIEDEVFGWSIDVHTVPKQRIIGSDAYETMNSSKDHYVYICRKGDHKLPSNRSLETKQAE